MLKISWASAENADALPNVAASGDGVGKRERGKFGDGWDLIARFGFIFRSSDGGLGSGTPGDAAPSERFGEPRELRHGVTVVRGAPSNCLPRRMRRSDGDVEDAAGWSLTSDASAGIL